MNLLTQPAESSPSPGWLGPSPSPLAQLWLQTEQVCVDVEPQISCHHL